MTVAILDVELDGLARAFEETVRTFMSESQRHCNLAGITETHLLRIRQGAFNEFVAARHSIVSQAVFQQNGGATPRFDTRPSQKLLGPQGPALRSGPLPQGVQRSIEA